MTRCGCGADVRAGNPFCAECGACMEEPKSPKPQQVMPAEAGSGGGRNFVVSTEGIVKSNIGTAPGGGNTVIAAGSVDQKRYSNITGNGEDAQPLSGALAQIPGTAQPAGRNMVIAGGDVDQSVHTSVDMRDQRVFNIVAGRDHAQYVAEYREEYRKVVSLLRDRHRTWLYPAESDLLAAAAKRLGLTRIEVEECEEQVMSRLGIKIVDTPPELWWITVPGNARPLGPKERHTLAVSLADYLDTHSPEQIMLCMRGAREWIPLRTDSAVFREAVEARKERFRELLLATAKAGNLSRDADRLTAASRYLSHTEQQEMRRAAERLAGKTIHVRFAAASEVPAPVPVAAISLRPEDLQGHYESEDDPSVHLGIAADSILFENNFPILQTGRAEIRECRFEGESFDITVRHVDGEFGGIIGLRGTATEDGLIIEELRGNLESGAEAFRCPYYKL